jgi:hypothetical protein
MIAGAIAAGTSQYGMQTFDQAIFSLYSQGIVTLEEALRWASNVDDFKLKVQGIATTSDMARDDMASKVVPSKPGAAPARSRAPRRRGRRSRPSNASADGDDSIFRLKAEATQLRPSCGFRL